MTDWDRTRRLRHWFEYDLGETVETSTGPTTRYLDGHALIMAMPSTWRTYFNDRIGPSIPLMTGRSGALILGLIGRGALVNLRGPVEGPEVLNPNDLRLARRRGIVLVDDVCFTHSTLDKLRGWAEARDFEVVREVVALPFMDPDDTIAERLVALA